ncbi:Protein of unknown function [Gryllus bimaculatus]|nr:Protein of unknown function [Gryllus bimaculatus]
MIQCVTLPCWLVTFENFNVGSDRFAPLEQDERSHVAPRGFRSVRSDTEQQVKAACKCPERPVEKNTLHPGRHVPQVAERRPASARYAAALGALVGAGVGEAVGAAVGVSLGARLDAMLGTSRTLSYLALFGRLRRRARLLRNRVRQEWWRARRLGHWGYAGPRL